MQRLLASLKRDAEGLGLEGPRPEGATFDGKGWSVEGKPQVVLSRVLTASPVRLAEVLLSGRQLFTCAGLDCGTSLGFVARAELFVSVPPFFKETRTDSLRSRDSRSVWYQPPVRSAIKRREWTDAPGPIYDVVVVGLLVVSGVAYFVT
jgi:hypothetical protein